VGATLRAMARAQEVQAKRAAAHHKNRMVKHRENDAVRARAKIAEHELAAGGGTFEAGDQRYVYCVSRSFLRCGDGVERVLARCDAYSGFGFCGALFLAIAQPPCRVLASRHAARHSFIHTNTESIAALTSPRWAKHRVLQATRQSLAVNALQ